MINADSMQVYRDLRVLTARPDRDDEATAPHRLFGHVDGAVNYSAGLWLANASVALTEARRDGRLPIFVGGTGLYFKALTRGMSAIPPVPEDVRAKVRSRAAALHRLTSMPASCTAIRQPRRDCGRAIRNAYCARSKSSRRPGKVSPLSMPHGRCRSSMRRMFSRYLATEREVLKARIDARFDVMLQAGALQEAAELRERRLDPALPVMRAHGVPHLIAHLKGEISQAEAARRASSTPAATPNGN